MHKKIDFTERMLKDARNFILEKMKSDLKIDTKSGANDFVTNVDKGVEQFIIDAINAEYDGQNFITEEGMVDPSSQGDVWIIDPIDGTTNFIYQKQDFAISIAYYEKNQPVFGMVYDIMADSLYKGIHGHGAYLDGEKLESLPADHTIYDAIFSGSISFVSYFEEDPMDFNRKIVAHRNLGSAALETSHIASGGIHIYLARHLNIWDIAAAVIILDEVGGHWRFGNEYNRLSLDQTRAFFLAAANENIFNYMNERINLEQV